MVPLNPPLVGGVKNVRYTVNDGLRTAHGFAFLTMVKHMEPLGDVYQPATCWVTLGSSEIAQAQARSDIQFVKQEGVGNLPSVGELASVLEGLAAEAMNRLPPMSEKIKSWVKHLERLHQMRRRRTKQV